MGLKPCPYFGPERDYAYSLIKALFVMLKLLATGIIFYLQALNT